MIAVGELIPGSRLIRKPRSASVPLAVIAEIAREAIQLGLSTAVIDHLLSLASREQVIDGLAQGRSYVVPLRREDWIATQGKTMTTARIKMATNHGDPPEMVSYDDRQNAVSQPPYRLAYSNITGASFEQNPPHPTGTGYLTEAEREFRTMSVAFSRSVPTDFPIGIGQFVELEFAGQSVGFGLMLTTQPEDQRIDPYIRGLLERAGNPGADKKSILQQGINELRRQAIPAARTMRTLHAAGIVHGHYSLGNCRTMDTDKVVATVDFTNARLHSEISREEFQFRAVNDFRHLYFSIAGILTQHVLPIEAALMLLRALEVDNPLDRSMAAAGKTGYFLEEDFAHHGQRNIGNAMAPLSFYPFAQRTWQPQAIAGKRLADLNHPSVKILAGIAGRLFDKLASA